MSVEDTRVVVVRWRTGFWGSGLEPAFIDEIAASDIRLEYALHQPLGGRDAVREFALRCRDAFPDLGFGATAELIAEGRLRQPVEGRRHAHRRRIRGPPDRGAPPSAQASGWSSPAAR